MSQTPTEPGDGPISELYPSLVEIASVYGDPEGKYASFLANADPSYLQQPYNVWAQNP